MRVILERRWPKDDYIIGRVYLDNEFFCNSLELPDKGNARNISCIPAGLYDVRLTYSSAFKRTLPLLMNVPGRSGIRIHRGNKAADTQGCILLGENKVKGQVVNSTPYEIELIKRLTLAEARKEKNIILIK